jgi:hypothetical protein
VADLSRRGRRGQILLVTAFVLAVMFVGLALVMNTVIYSENLATRADSTTSQPILHANSMETGTEDVIRYINEHDTSPSMTDYSPLRADLEDAFENISAVSGRHSLRDGQVTDDSLGTEFHGTWIRQTNSTRNFTRLDTASSWTPVPDANGARSLRIHVNDAIEPNGPSAFMVEATDTSGDSWRLHVGDDEVSVEDSGGNIYDCPHSDPASGFWVNVSSGAVEGTDCAGLTFAADLGTIEKVDYENAENITGTYRLIANDTESDVDTGQYGATTGPFVEKGIYGAWIEIDSERESLVFRTDRRVIPGDEDD